MRIKIISFVLLLFLFNGNLAAQIITTEPTFPTSESQVIITYNTAEGNKAFAGLSEDIYAHTGVITDKSTGPTDWKYVISAWDDHPDKAKLSPIGSGLYEFVIEPSIREFYGVPVGEKILKMAFVFKNIDNSITGRTSSGGDIFVDVYEDTGLNVHFELPSTDAVLVEPNESIQVKANSLNADSLALFVDNIFHSSTNEASLSANIETAQSGKFWVKAKAYSNSGLDIEVDSFYYFVRPTQIVAALPENIKDGINYIDDNSVVLCLYAPEKKYVFAIGDFSDWEVNEDVYMNKTPDGLRYWVQLNNLVKSKSYIYQYFVDGENRYADIYCEQISDPWNDKYIDQNTFPNLPDYPVGKTSGIASVFATAQSEYTWQTSDFKKPKITDLVIYETLLRDITTDHSYQSLIDTLGYFKRLGINAIELMPINEFEGNLSWGYNPAFYFAPDKYYGTKNDLKAFVDACHSQGIAVIIDMVLNHSYGLNPMVQMYWDKAKNRPAANNPWFNETSPNSTYSWGYDFNHESEDTKAFVDSVNSYWISKYKVDGFRFDFTKGFTNTTGNGWAYDASRIEILSRMANKIWSVDPESYVILEHFADNSEEKELADKGFMIWGNMNGSFKEAHLGFTDNGNSDIEWASYIKRGWANPNLVVYMESHDEERQMVYTKSWGNNDGGGYDIKTETTSLNRMKLGFVFDFMIPGPKMLWQFEELGYDISINYPSGTDADRLTSKPNKWSYQFDTRRKSLYNLVASMAALKQNLPIFETSDFNLDVYNALKRVKLNSDIFNIVTLGNFDVVSGNIAGSFQHTGTWYEYFSGTTLVVSDVNMNISLNAGEYRLYSDTEITAEDLMTDVLSIDSSVEKFTIYPNPANQNIQIRLNPEVKGKEWILYNMQGQEVLSGIWNSNQSTENINIVGLKSGIYLFELKTLNLGKIRQLLIKN